jgi:hypothetical protein
MIRRYVTKTGGTFIIRSSRKSTDDQHVIETEVCSVDFDFLIATHNEKEKGDEAVD